MEELPIIIETPIFVSYNHTLLSPYIQAMEFVIHRVNVYFFCQECQFLGKVQSLLTSLLAPQSRHGKKNTWS